MKQSRIIEHSRKFSGFYLKKKERVHFSRDKQHYVATYDGSNIFIFMANKLGKLTDDKDVTDVWTIEASSYLFDLY
jgi:hypothetical protein